MPIATLLSLLSVTTPGVAQQSVVWTELPLRPGGDLAAHLELQFPSPRPLGDPINDRVYAELFVPVAPAPPPLVVVLHQYAAQGDWLSPLYRRKLNAAGLAALLVELPYHFHRLPPGMRSSEALLQPDVDHIVGILDQAAADASEAARLAAARPEVDGSRRGITGLSLGAMVSLIAVARDPQFAAAVSVLGAGDLPTILREGFITTHVWKQLTADPAARAAAEAKLAALDPIHASPPPQLPVLFVAARHDRVIPPGATQRTIAAFPHAETLWVNSAHHTAFLSGDALFGAGTAYLRDHLGLAPGTFRARAIAAFRLRLGLLAHTKGYIGPAAVLGWSGLDPEGSVSVDLGAGVKSAFVGLSAEPVNNLHVGVGTSILSQEPGGPFAYVTGSWSF